MRSSRITFALIKVAFLLLCLESLRRNQRVEMAWKKIASARFLPETLPPTEIASQIVVAEEVAGWAPPQGRRSQDQRALANLGEELMEIWFFTKMVTVTSRGHEVTSGFSHIVFRSFPKEKTPRKASQPRIHKLILDKTCPRKINSSSSQEVPSILKGEGTRRRIHPRKSIHGRAVRNQAFSSGNKQEVLLIIRKI